MTRDEIDQLKKRVVGRAVTWGSPGNASSGVVEDVTLVGADSLRLSGFSGLDVTVATYYRLQGDGERWGVRAAAKHLGLDDDRVAALRAALVRRKPLDYRRSRASSCGRRGSRRCRTTCPSSSRRSSAPRSRGAMCVSCTVPAHTGKAAPPGQEETHTLCEVNDGGAWTP